MPNVLKGMEEIMFMSRMIIVIHAFFVLTHAAAQDSRLYQSHFPPEEFKIRWEKIFDKIGDNAMAVVQGAPGVDGFKVFRQSNAFYYLCGLETPHSTIVLDGRSRRVTLYLPYRNEGQERSEGGMLTAEDAEMVKELTSVNAVYGSDMMARHWTWMLVRVPPPLLYTPFSPAEGRAQSRDVAVGGQAGIASDAWDGRPSREGNFIHLLRTRFPQFEIRDLSPILDEMRTVKSPREIDLIRRASEIAALGIMEAMRCTEPGAMEYQLDAAARFVFRINGAQGESYSSITAGGTNAWMGHYFRNNCRLENGDLVLMDFAPDYGYYTSDVTRMWPVNGRFSPEQRELCGFILKIHDALLKRIRPGITVSQVYDEAAGDMEKIFRGIKWSKDIYRNAAEKAIHWHGHLTHPVGMAVHDVGDYKARPLEPGVVIALDPMMWVPEEKLYIRIENCVVVTEEGVENMSEMIPAELDDIEKLMKEKGILQNRPAVFKPMELK
jgi:Xaa-Pro aminopeptidase